MAGPGERLTVDAAGVFIISATPFSEDGAIDYDSADRLVEFYLGHGVSGMTVLGMMGEAPKLSPVEAQDFLSHMIARVAGRVPVVVGVSNADIDQLLDLSKASMDQGAAGVMIAPPKGTAPDVAYYDYFAECFDALGSDIPVCLQDFPLATQAPLSVETFHRLVRDFDQLVMLKHEDWPGLNKLSEIRRDAAETGTRRTSILCGNGGIFLPEEMQRGADGAMTGFAFPEMLVNIVNLSNAGRHERAQDLFDAYLPLIRLEQQPGVGLAIRKEILRRRGAIKSANLRAPGVLLTSEDQNDVTRLLTRLDRALSVLAGG